MDSTFTLRIPLTVAESATAQFNYTNNLLFICGFHKLFWIPQMRLRIPQNCLISERFWAIQCFRYLFVEFKTAKKIKEKSQSCGFRDKSDFGLLRYPLIMHIMHSWPRNDEKSQLRLFQLLKHSTNLNILKKFDGLSFDFYFHFRLFITLPR